MPATIPRVLKPLFLALAACVPLATISAAEELDRGKIIEEAMGDYSGCLVLEVAAETTDRLLYNAAMCTHAAAPCSTFKIPNTLIGLETGVLSGPDFVIQWDGVERSMPNWNKDQTLTDAFKNSTVWYYQEVARRIGPERMQQHLDAFQYGNRDISGGIDQFWLGSSLKISASEQVAFLRKLQAGELPLSPQTYAAARKVMLLETRNGVQLFGKTGTDGDLKSGKMILGWFVGWLENEAPGKDPVFFALRIEGGEKPWGPNARRIAEEILMRLDYWPGASEVY